MKPNLRNIVIAGILGTVAFDALGTLLTGNLFDIPKLLAAKLEAPLAVGLALHYINGVILSVLYTAISPLIAGNRWFRPVVFITVQTVVGVFLFMMPLVGAGAFGLKMGLAFPLIALVRHWAYALVLGAFTPKEAAEASGPLRPSRDLPSAG